MVILARALGRPALQAPTYVQLHKYEAIRMHSERATEDLIYGITPHFWVYAQNFGWHIDCLIGSQSMTTAVLRIAEASVGQSAGIGRPH